MAGSGWQLRTIDELKANSASSIAIGPFGSRMKSECYVASGVPVIRGNNISDTRDLVGEMVYITSDKAEELRASIIYADDLFFPHRGAIGQVGIVPRNGADRYILSSSLMKLTCDRKQVEPLYLFYFFRSEQGRHELLKNASTVGTPGIGQPLSTLKSIQVPTPYLSQQKVIAHILSTLDDKIELNRRMNATLEAMARALFQSWFVDFDPVRAKLDGRIPIGLDAATAALFPATFQDSFLGHIPKGWEVKTVGEIGKVVCGKTPSTAISNYYGKDVPFITIPDMHGNVFAASTARKLSYAGANSQANKTLPPGSICVSCIATPGLVVVTSENSQTNQQINSIIPHQCDESYFWYWVMTGLGAEIASSGSGGSVLTNLSKGRFETLQVVKPPHALIRAYHSAARPLFERILANTRQSSTLATLRDTLLPKLISGELRVKVDEPYVAEAIP